VLGSCCYGIVRPGPKVQRLSADNKRTVEALQKTPEETASLPAHPGRLLFSPSTWPSAQPKRRGQSLPSVSLFHLHSPHDVHPQHPETLRSTPKTTGLLPHAAPLYSHTLACIT
jgi:hypothetical protein